MSGADSRMGGVRWRDLRFALEVAWSHRPRSVSLAALAGIASALVAPALAVVVRGLINAAATADGDAAMRWLAGLLVLSTVGVVTQGLYSYVLRSLREDVDLEVSVGLLRHAAALEYRSFENREFQDTVQRAREDSSLYVSSFVASVLGLATSLAMAVSLLALLGAVVPQFLVAMSLPSLVYLGLRWQLARRLFEEEAVRSAKFRWNYYFSRALTEPPLVTETRLLGLEGHFLAGFRETLEELRDRFGTLLRRELVADLLFGGFASVVVFLMLRQVIGDVVAGELTVGDVGLVGAAGLRLRSALQEAIAGIGGLRRNLLHVRNVSDFFALPVADAMLKSRGPAGPGAVSLEGVTFTYPGATEPALCDIELAIEPGETLALVGENGCGKSTMAKLIAGLHKADVGVVRIDGTDVSELSRAALTEMVFFSLQDVNRFEATAAESLAYADWQRFGDDRAAVEDVAARAGVAELVRSWPKGFDTRLGILFGEHMPSTGQWQQIALARAFARDARVMILDEPTASLDMQRAQRLIERVRDLAPQRTTVLISHAWPTIRSADRIAVLERGRIVEVGSHEQLLAAGGRYFQMHESSRPEDAVAG